MQITFSANNIDDLRAQLWVFLNGPGPGAAVPEQRKFTGTEMVTDEQGRQMPVVPAWAPRGSMWVGSPYGYRLIAPDGAEVKVDWLDLSKPA